MSTLVKRALMKIIENAKKKGATNDEIYILTKAVEIAEKYDLADLKVI